MPKSFGGQKVGWRLKRKSWNMAPQGPNPKPSFSYRRYWSCNSVLPHP